MRHEQPTGGEVSPPPQQPTEAPPAAPAEHHEDEPVIQPRIWVASLSDYNNGTLHGQWLDAAQDEAELQAGIATMLASSPLTARTGEPAEEWAIHDYQGFGALPIYEHENLSWISRVAKGIAQHGLAFAAYADVMEDEELLTGFEDDYLGHYDDLHTYVEQLINDLGYDRILDEALPASIRPARRLRAGRRRLDIPWLTLIQLAPLQREGLSVFSAH
jgi:antirestriction protein